MEETLIQRTSLERRRSAAREKKRRLESMYSHQQTQRRYREPKFDEESVTRNDPNISGDAEAIRAAEEVGESLEALGYDLNGNSFYSMDGSHTLDERYKLMRAVTSESWTMMDDTLEQSTEDWHPDERRQQQAKDRDRSMRLAESSDHSSYSDGDDYESESEASSANDSLSAITDPSTMPQSAAPKKNTGTILLQFSPILKEPPIRCGTFGRVEIEEAKEEARQKAEKEVRNTKSKQQSRNRENEPTRGKSDNFERSIPPKEERKIEAEKERKRIAVLGASAAAASSAATNTKGKQSRSQRKDEMIQSRQARQQVTSSRTRDELSERDVVRRKLPEEVQSKATRRNSNRFFQSRQKDTSDTSRSTSRDRSRATSESTLPKRSRSRSRSKPESGIKSSSRSTSQPKARSRSRPRSTSRTRAKSRSESRSRPKLKTRSKSRTRSQSRSRSKSKMRVEETTLEPSKARRKRSTSRDKKTASKKAGKPVKTISTPRVKTPKKTKNDKAARVASPKTRKPSVSALPETDAAAAAAAAADESKALVMQKSNIIEPKVVVARSDTKPKHSTSNKPCVAEPVTPSPGKKRRWTPFRSKQEKVSTREQSKKPLIERNVEMSDQKSTGPEVSESSTNGSISSEESLQEIATEKDANAWPLSIAEATMTAMAAGAVGAYAFASSMMVDQKEGDRGVTQAPSRDDLAKAALFDETTTAFSGWTDERSGHPKGRDILPKKSLVNETSTLMSDDTILLGRSNLASDNQAHAVKSASSSRAAGAEAAAQRNHSNEGGSKPKAMTKKSFFGSNKKHFREARELRLQEGTTGIEVAGKSESRTLKRRKRKAALKAKAKSEAKLKALAVLKIREAAEAPPAKDISNQKDTQAQSCNVTGSANADTAMWVGGTALLGSTGCLAPATSPLVAKQDDANTEDDGSQMPMSTSLKVIPSVPQHLSVPQLNSNTAVQTHQSESDGATSKQPTKKRTLPFFGKKKKQFREPRELTLSKSNTGIEVSGKSELGRPVTHVKLSSKAIRNEPAQTNIQEPTRSTPSYKANTTSKEEPEIPKSALYLGGAAALGAAGYLASTMYAVDQGDIDDEGSESQSSKSTNSDFTSEDASTIGADREDMGKDHTENVNLPTTSANVSGASASTETPTETIGLFSRLRQSIYSKEENITKQTPETGWPSCTSNNSFSEDQRHDNHDDEKNLILEILPTCNNDNDSYSGAAPASSDIQKEKKGLFGKLRQSIESKDKDVASATAETMYRSRNSFLEDHRDEDEQNLMFEMLPSCKNTNNSFSGENSGRTDTHKEKKKLFGKLQPSIPSKEKEVADQTGETGWPSCTNNNSFSEDQQHDNDNDEKNLVLEMLPSCNNIESSSEEKMEGEEADEDLAFQILSSAVSQCCSTDNQDGSVHDIYNREGRPGATAAMPADGHQSKSVMNNPETEKPKDASLQPNETKTMETENGEKKKRSRFKFWKKRDKKKKISTLVVDRTKQSPQVKDIQPSGKKERMQAVPLRPVKSTFAKQETTKEIDDTQKMDGTQHEEQSYAEEVAKPEHAGSSSDNMCVGATAVIGAPLASAICSQRDETFEQEGVDMREKSDSEISQKQSKSWNTRAKADQSPDSTPSPYENGDDNEEDSSFLAFFTSICSPEVSGVTDENKAANVAAEGSQGEGVSAPRFNDKTWFERSQASPESIEANIKGVVDEQSHGYCCDPFGHANTESPTDSAFNDKTEDESDAQDRSPSTLYGIKSASSSGGSVLKTKESTTTWQPLSLCGLGTLATKESSDADDMDVTVKEEELQTVVNVPDRGGKIQIWQEIDDRSTRSDLNQPRSFMCGGQPSRANLIDEQMNEMLETNKSLYEASTDEDDSTLNEPPVQKRGLFAACGLCQPSSATEVDRDDATFASEPSKNERNTTLISDSNDGRSTIGVSADSEDEENRSRTAAASGSGLFVTNTICAGLCWPAPIVDKEQVITSDVPAISEEMSEDETDPVGFDVTGSSHSNGGEGARGSQTIETTKKESMDQSEADGNARFASIRRPGTSSAQVVDNEAKATKLEEDNAKASLCWPKASVVEVDKSATMKAHGTDKTIQSKATESVDEDNSNGNDSSFVMFAPCVGICWPQYNGGVDESDMSEPAKEDNNKKPEDDELTKIAASNASSFVTFAPCIGVYWPRSYVVDVTSSDETEASEVDRGKKDRVMGSEIKSEGMCANLCSPRLDTLDCSDHDEAEFNNLFVRSQDSSVSETVDDTYDTRRPSGIIGMMKRMLHIGEREDDLAVAIRAVRTISSRNMSDVDIEQALSRFSDDEEDSLQSHDSFQELQDAIWVVKKHSERIGVSEKDFIRTLSRGDLKSDNIVNKVGRVTGDFFDTIEDNYLQNRSEARFQREAKMRGET